MEFENCEHDYDYNLMQCNICGRRNYELAAELSIYNDCIKTLGDILKILKNGLSGDDKTRLSVSARFVEMSIDVVFSSNIKSVLTVMIKDILNTENDEVERNTALMMSLSRTHSIMRDKIQVGIDIDDQKAREIAMMAMSSVADGLPDDFKAVVEYLQWEINDFEMLPTEAELDAKYPEDVKFFRDKDHHKAMMIQTEFKQRMSETLESWIESDVDDLDPKTFANKVGELVHFYVSNLIVLINPKKQLPETFLTKEYDAIIECANLEALLGHELFSDEFVAHVKGSVIKSVQGHGKQYAPEERPRSFKDSFAFNRIVIETGKLLEHSKPARA